MFFHISFGSSLMPSWIWGLPMDGDNDGVKLLQSPISVCSGWHVNGQSKFYIFSTMPSTFQRNRMQLIMFTKMLKNVGNLTLDRAGDQLVEMGFEGVDLTVREGGYVTPEEAGKRLPEALDVLRSKGLSVPMITTSVVDPHRGYAREIFKAASDCGIKYLKLGYWEYEGFGAVKEQIGKMQNDLNGIYKLSEEFDVNSAVHIHSGNYLSSNPALLWMLLRDYDPHYLGAYIDPGHMAVEGGAAGWRIGMDMLQEKTRMVAVKDFGWFREGDVGQPDKKGWRADIVPLSAGLVPWAEVFQYLQRMAFDGPVSLHSEYDNLSFEDLIGQTRKDLSYVKDILKRL
jgi:sugar phosphate isomerase/epimerase